ncbi:MAG: SOS response-associated peptidase [Flavipsychrobacter sp.]
MCYHTSTAVEPKLKEYLPGYDVKNAAFYYHLSGFDHKFIPVTTNEHPLVVDGGIWGLVPGWVHESARAKEIADMTLNARCEKVFTTASYKNYIGKNRCLIWVDGFYEWQWRDNGKNKIPHYIYMPNHQPFSFGGIYSNWARPDTGEIMTTVSIITTPANDLMAEIHNNKKRMPFIVLPEERDKWLGQLDKQEIADIMRPCPDGLLQAHTISKAISQRGIDTNVPEIQKPVPYDLPPSTGTLF